MTTPSIMGYNPGAHVVGTGGFAIADPLYQQLITFSFGTGGTNGIRKFDAYPHGAELLSRSVTDMAIGGLFQPTCLTQSGLICFAKNASNSVILYMVRQSDLRLQQQFGVESSGLAPSQSFRILLPYSMHSHRAGGTDYLVTSSLVTANEINSINLTTNLNTNLGTITETTAVVGGTPSQSPGSAVTYVLGRGNYTGSHSAASLGLYTVVGTTLTRIGSIPPSAIDATWSHFIAANGLAIDQTDGNPIISVGTDDVVANQHYLVKLNKATAAIIWALPVAQLDANADQDMKQCNITQQTMYYLASTTLYTINTATGAATTQTIGTVNVTGEQISEDVSGSIFYSGGWNETTTHPLYIGDYMGSGGNHAPSNIWFRFFPGAITAPPTPPGGDPAQSRKRAWGFTLDGHTFYVLDLGAEGTFLYDITTGEWSNWVTAGFVQWDVANGVMWDKRVVGGDLASGQVWEARNSQLTDNGTDIAHTVTGKLETRSRVFLSVDALRLSGSFGEIGDPSSTTINMRFSDDDGQTFSAMFPLTMAAGNTTGELAWRSMGSFCAPGRVFEISDTGGLVRIDGLDAFINNFDEDNNTQAQGDGGGGGGQ